MILSQKSLNFARKILKYNPIPQKSHNHSQQQSCQHQKCEHNHLQKNHKNSQMQSEIKPYLHVHDHRKQRQIYQKPTSQKLQNMKTFKQQGNQHFKQKRYQQASYFYNKVIIFSDYTFPQIQKDQLYMDELVQQANCNLGITYIKLNQYKGAQTNLLQASKGPIQKLKKKGNYWLTKVYIKLGQFTKAQDRLKQLQKSKQDANEQIKQLQGQLKSEKQKYQKKSQNIYSQMLSN